MTSPSEMYCKCMVHHLFESQEPPAATHVLLYEFSYLTEDIACCESCRLEIMRIHNFTVKDKTSELGIRPLTKKRMARMMAQRLKKVASW